MMRRSLVLWACLLSSALAVAAPASVKAPKPLLAQVERLTELLRDSHAMGYPEATMVQIVPRRSGEALALVVFTVEGFGGGNNHTQYLAAFTPETNDEGRQHFQLIDVMPIGGKGWRGITTLNARVKDDPRTGEAALAIDALAVGEDDAPNFPTRKVTIQLRLRNGRLVER